MLAAKRHQAQDLFVTLTLFGGRWDELVRLTVDQIQMNGTIRLYGYKTQRERIVSCPAPMVEALVRRRLAAEAADSVYLFPAVGKEGLQRWSGTIKWAFERAGFNAPHLVERHGRTTIHSLQHTFPSWLLQNGMNLLERFHAGLNRFGLPARSCDVIHRSPVRTGGGHGVAEWTSLLG